MIKKIDASQLKVGMFIHDLSCNWMDHPFMRNRFLVSSDAEIRKIVEAGIHDVYIDTDKGLDDKNAPTVDEVQAGIERELIDIAVRQPAQIVRTSFGEELARAKKSRAKPINWCAP